VHHRELGLQLRALGIVELAILVRIELLLQAVTVVARAGVIAAGRGKPDGASDEQGGRGEYQLQSLDQHLQFLRTGFIATGVPPATAREQVGVPARALRITQVAAKPACDANPGRFI
jgi:hypothetical protein